MGLNIVLAIVAPALGLGALWAAHDMSSSSVYYFGFARRRRDIPDQLEEEPADSAGGPIEVGDLESGLGAGCFAHADLGSKDVLLAREDATAGQHRNKSNKTTLVPVRIVKLEAGGLSGRHVWDLWWTDLKSGRVYAAETKAKSDLRAAMMDTVQADRLDYLIREKMFLEKVECSMARQGEQPLPGPEADPAKALERHERALRSLEDRIRKLEESSSQELRARADDHVSEPAHKLIQ